MFKKSDLQGFTFLPHLSSDSSEPSGQFKTPSQNESFLMQVTPSSQSSAGGKQSAEIIRTTAITAEQ